MQAGPRPLDPEPRGRNEQEADIDEDALLVEEDRADDRQLTQDRDRDRRQAVDVRVRQALPEDAGQAGTEECQGQARHDLVGPQMDRDQPVEQRDGPAGVHEPVHGPPRGRAQTGPQEARHHDGQEEVQCERAETSEEQRVDVSHAPER